MPDFKNKRFKEVVFERATKLAELEKEGYSLPQAAKKLSLDLSLCYYSKRAYPELFKSFRTTINPTPFLNAQAFKDGVVIHEPPVDVPEPEGVTRKPWVELERNQCQWSLDTDFFVEASNTFPCCGLPTEKGKPYCEHHNKYLKRGWKDEK